MLQNALQHILFVPILSTTAATCPKIFLHASKCSQRSLNIPKCSCMNQNTKVMQKRSLLTRLRISASVRTVVRRVSPELDESGQDSQKLCLLWPGGSQRACTSGSIKRRQETTFLGSFCSRLVVFPVFKDNQPWLSLVLKPVWLRMSLLLRSLPRKPSTLPNSQWSALPERIGGLNRDATAHRSVSTPKAQVCKVLALLRGLLALRSLGRALDKL